MDFKRLKDFLDGYLGMLGIPGSDTSIYLKGEEVFRYQSGYSNIEKKTPVDPKGLYNIYSCSKISMMCTVLQLAERGDIHITDPVFSYFPEYRDLLVRFKKENGEWDVRPAKTVMTIRHLMTMSSGLDYNLNAQGIREVKERTNGRCPTVETVRAMAKEPLWFDPGADFRYSLSHDVLGGIVELVSGKSLGAYMKENLFDPLGMKDTSFVINEERAARFNTQYRYDETAHKPVEMTPYDLPYRLGTEYQSGGAGLISSVDDYVLLADALAHMGRGKNGERILSSSAVELLRTNALTGKAFETYSTENVTRYGYGYGLGVRTMLNPAAGGSLSNKGEFGWDGAKLCYFIADPALELGVFHAEHMGYFHKVVIPRLHNVIYSCLDA